MKYLAFLHNKNREKKIIFLWDIKRNTILQSVKLLSQTKRNAQMIFPGGNVIM